MWPQENVGESFPCGSISIDDLLSGLDHFDRGKLESIEDRITMLPGKIVFASGDPVLNIYVHLSGRATLVQDSGANATVYSCPVGPHQIYGLIEALSESGFQMGMKTMTKSEFDVIDRGDFLDLIRSQPDVCFRLAEIVSTLYQHGVCARVGSGGGVPN